MAYRNGTYIAFHADGSTDPTESDIKYYRLMKAWHKNDDIEFRFINSHDKSSAVRDSSKRETLARSLRERLNNSKNMVLIIGNTTRFDVDWVPYEIAYAVDKCKIPIIVTYTGFKIVAAPWDLSYLWPLALKERIDDKSSRCIHIPFKQNIIDHAIRRFDLSNPPFDSLNHFSRDVHNTYFNIY